MKATGIVRRIDDLGRVVIPKEIRRTMRIREGDPTLTSLTPVTRFLYAIMDISKRFGVDHEAWYITPKGVNPHKKPDRRLNRGGDFGYVEKQILHCCNQRNRPAKKVEIVSKKVWTFVLFCGIVVCWQEVQQMKSMIKELWHGNITPQEDSRNNSP